MTTAWQDDALCAQIDTEIFFPENGTNGTEAKQICAACPVIQECLTYALDHPELTGIWGGQSRRERQTLRRERSAA